MYPRREIWFCVIFLWKLVGWAQGHVSTPAEPMELRVMGMPELGGGATRHLSYTDCSMTRERNHDLRRICGMRGGEGIKKKKHTSSWLCNLLVSTLMLEVKGKASKEPRIWKEFCVFYSECLMSNYFPASFSRSLTKGSCVCATSVWHWHLTQIQQTPLSIKPCFSFSHSPARRTSPMQHRNPSYWAAVPERGTRAPRRLAHRPVGSVSESVLCVSQSREEGRRRS